MAGLETDLNKIQRMSDTSSETTRAPSKPEWIPYILWLPLLFARQPAQLLTTWHFELWFASMFAFRLEKREEGRWGGLEG